MDDVKALLENSGYGLEALKNSLGSGGGGGNGGGVACQFSIKEDSVVLNDEVISTLPYDFYGGSAVVFNNEIHILGSDNSHYKWDGKSSWSSSWDSISTLPYDFYGGSAVVFNDEIHILGSSESGAPTKHYKWNGKSWTSASTLPYKFYYGSAVVLNNEIHILGGSGNSIAHYKLKKIANLITLFLQSGNKIICDTEKTGPISDNLKKVDFGYECIKTGLCKMYDMNGNTNNIIFTII